MKKSVVNMHERGSGAVADAVFTVGSLIFILALVPTLRSEEKPPPATGLLTGSVLLAFAATYASLGFWYSCATSGLLGSLWLVVAWQAARRID